MLRKNGKKLSSSPILLIFLPKFSETKHQIKEYEIFGKRKRKRKRRNLEFDGKIGVAIVAVNGAVTRSLGLDAAESDGPAGGNALGHAGIGIATEPGRGRPEPLPSAHLLGGTRPIRTQNESVEPNILRSDSLLLLQ